MMQSSVALCFTGLLLFMLGLLNGLVIPRLRSPRLGLSAHLTAVQSTGLWVSLYAIWFALFLSGLFGAGEGLAIAGQGMTTSRARQRLVTIILAAGSLGCLIATGGVLVAWRWV